MNEIYKLLFFTFLENEPLGEVSEKKLETIHSFLDEVDLLTVRIAQLNYNKRVKAEEKYWWDDLKVYLGIHRSNTKELSILKSSTTAPFGLLYEIFTISGSSQTFAIKYNWDILERDGLFHTDVDEFSTFSLSQEYDILNNDGLLKSIADDKWDSMQPELEEQIVHSAEDYVNKKTTLIIIELLFHRENLRKSERLKAFIEIYRLLKMGDLQFSHLEKFVICEREIAEAVGGYINENKIYEEFDLSDFFDFGFQTIELSYYFQHDFHIFLEYVEDIIMQNDTDSWSKEELNILENLHQKYIDNN